MKDNERIRSFNGTFNFLVISPPFPDNNEDRNLTSILVTRNAPVRLKTKYINSIVNAITLNVLSTNERAMFDELNSTLRTDSIEKLNPIKMIDTTVNTLFTKNETLSNNNP